MAQLAEVRWVRRNARHVSQCQRPLAWPHKSAELRSVAEDMLQEMAFVYQATRSVRESMMEEALGMEEGSVDPAAGYVPERALELATFHGSD
jgi:hypothetical protein